MNHTKTHKIDQVVDNLIRSLISYISWFYSKIFFLLISKKSVERIYLKKKNMIDSLLST